MIWALRGVVMNHAHGGEYGNRGGCGSVVMNPIKQPHGRGYGARSGFCGRGRRGADKFGGRGKTA